MKELKTIYAHRENEGVFLNYFSFVIQKKIVPLHRFWFRYNNRYGLKGNKV